MSGISPIYLVKRQHSSDLFFHFLFFAEGDGRICEIKSRKAKPLSFCLDSETRGEIITATCFHRKEKGDDSPRKLAEDFGELLHEYCDSTLT